MLAPFRHVTDSRYEWLQNVSIQYLEKWKVSIDSREGFTNSEKNRMFLAQPTYEGLKITAYSTIEATRYLLNDGMLWVITSRFNQDCAEEDFGWQRSLGGRNDNPTIHQFGYQANTLRMQRSVVVPTGRLHCVCNGLWWYQQVTPGLHILQKDNFHGSMSMKLHYRKERLAFNCNEELHFLIT